jgi:hypothetical protein
MTECYKLVNYIVLPIWCAWPFAHSIFILPGDHTFWDVRALLLVSKKRGTVLCSEASHEETKRPRAGSFPQHRTCAVPPSSTLYATTLREMKNWPWERTQVGGRSCHQCSTVRWWRCPPSSTWCVPIVQGRTYSDSWIFLGIPNFFMNF